MSELEPLSQPGAPKAICGAKTRSGGQCTQRPVRGMKRCRMHGGTQPVGVASPFWKHGRDVRPRYRISGPLGDAYQRHLADPDYMALDQELALVSGQLEEVALELSELRPLEPAVYEVGGPCTRCEQVAGVHPVRNRVPRCLDHQPKMLSGHVPEECAQRLVEIGRLQARLGQLIEQRRKLSDTEVTRVKAAQDNLSAETARLMGHALLVALREESGDLELVGRVQARTVLILKGLGLKVGA